MAHVRQLCVPSHLDPVVRSHPVAVEEEPQDTRESQPCAALGQEDCPCRTLPTKQATEMRECSRSCLRVADRAQSQIHCGFATTHLRNDMYRFASLLWMHRTPQ